MRAYEMWDTSTIPDGIRRLQKKYPNPSKDMFVVIQKGSLSTIVPFKSFLRRPMIYQTIIAVNTIEIIRINGVVENLSTMTQQHCVKLLTDLGLNNIDETIEHLSKTNNFNGPRQYGQVFYYILTRRIQGGQLTGSKIPQHAIRGRLESLGISAIVDSHSGRDGSIINKRFPSLGMATPKSTNEVDKATLDMNQEVIVDEYTQRIAISIAEVVLDSELNTDDPYVEGPDHYFWTYDGMQLRITQTSTMGGQIPGLLFDIETPYGILYHISISDESEDDILQELRTKYNRMTQPLTNWRPLDRDIFLHNKQLDYKDNGLRVSDLVQEVGKYYPEMREYAHRYKINLKPLTEFSDINKTFLSGVVDVFASQPSARGFLNQISNNEDITDISTLEQYFPRQRLPVNFEYEDLKKMALVYDVAKKNNPNTRGWRVFHHTK